MSQHVTVEVAGRVSVRVSLGILARAAKASVDSQNHWSRETPSAMQLQIGAEDFVGVQ